MATARARAQGRGVEARTAWRWVRPSARDDDGCVPVGAEQATPRIARRAMARMVSRMGTPRMATGTATSKTAQEGPRRKEQTTDRKYPRRESRRRPMKIEAGLKLKTRKPRQRPAMAAVYSASSGLPLASARTNVVPQRDGGDSRASPSSPSIGSSRSSPGDPEHVNGTANVGQAAGGGRRGSWAHDGEPAPAEEGADPKLNDRACSGRAHARMSVDNSETHRGNGACEKDNRCRNAAPRRVLAMRLQRETNPAAHSQARTIPTGAEPRDGSRVDLPHTSNHVDEVMAHSEKSLESPA